MDDDGCEFKEEGSAVKAGSPGAGPGRPPAPPSRLSKQRGLAAGVFLLWLVLILFQRSTPSGQEAHSRRLAAIESGKKEKLELARRLAREGSCADRLVLADRLYELKRLSQSEGEAGSAMAACAADARSQAALRLARARLAAGDYQGAEAAIGRQSAPAGAPGISSPAEAALKTNRALIMLSQALANRAEKEQLLASVEKLAAESTAAGRSPGCARAMKQLAALAVRERQSANWSMMHAPGSTGSK